MKNFLITCNYPCHLTDEEARSLHLKRDVGLDLLDTETGGRLTVHFRHRRRLNAQDDREDSYEETHLADTWPQARHLAWTHPKETIVRMLKDFRQG